MKDWLLRYKIAEHEACHAVVAQKMGLPVAWVSIDPGCDEGLNFQAAVKIPDELIDFERDVEAICVAMASPSFLGSHEKTGDLWRYAQIEADLAYTIAGKNGIDPDDIYERAAWLVTEYHTDIVDLAARLCEEGRVEFALA